MEHSNTTRYLNLDVLLSSDRDLTPLIEELGDRIFVLCNEPNPNGGFYTAFEPPIGGESDELPQSHATSMISTINSLSAQSRHLWDSCSSRFFDFGFESGNHPISLMHDLSSDTLSGIAALGAQMRISIYAVPEPPNHSMHQTLPLRGTAGDFES